MTTVRWRPAAGCLLALLLCAAAACVDAGRGKRAVDPVRHDYTAGARAWADSVAASMSDSLLAGQVLMPALYARCSEADMARLAMYADSLHVGGILLLRGDTASARRIADSLASVSPVVPLVAIDAEWGLGMRLRDAPSYTVNGDLPDSIEDRALYDYGYAIGRQAAAVGVNVIFGPVLDVAPSRATPIGRRSFGADPARVAELGIAYARGVEDGNVLSVAKHFPGLGSAMADTHRAQPLMTQTRARLDSVDLLPFSRYVAAGLSGVMIGHQAVLALDTVVRSAAVSPAVITGLLRDEMGFGGIIFTDALNMEGLGRVRNPAVAALLAGADVVVAPADTRRTRDSILSALASGALPRDTLRSRVARILFHKYRLSLR